MKSSMRSFLVTGAHRTGTTWVGRMLAAAPRLAYISEPLNVFHHPGILGAPVPYWYTYICNENESEYLPPFQQLLNFRYHFFSAAMSLRSGRDFLRIGRDLGIFWQARLLHRLPLLKDPFAVFSIPWFVQRLNSRVVVTVRHPAAFASSLKRMNWSFDFNDLLNQPLLMHDHLEPYRKEMRSVAADDVIGQASLLWTMVYRIVHANCKQNPSIRVVRHEDLSLDPVASYQQLYGELGLDFTPRVKRKIMDSSSSENPAELSRKKVHSVKLDSRANLDNWKHRLSSAEIDLIRRATEEVAHLYYPEVDWN
jgi:Sulfotransferase family